RAFRKRGALARRGRAAGLPASRGGHPPDRLARGRAGGPEPPALGPARLHALVRALRCAGGESRFGANQSVALPGDAMPDLLDAFLAFALALVVVWISTPVVKALAWRIGAIDEPRERGLHQFPTPRLGGLAILPGVVAAAPAFLPNDQQTRSILIRTTVILAVG